MKHIKTTGFKATDNKSANKNVTVNFNEHAHFTLSAFALSQLSKAGFAVITDQKQIDHSDVGLLRKVSLYGLDWSENQTLPLERDEVLQLRYWLEARMTHCETERAEELRKTQCLEDAVARSSYSMDEYISQYPEDAVQRLFDQDTYITMKLLLLDIREWLIGEIIY